MIGAHAAFYGSPRAAWNSHIGVNGIVQVLFWRRRALSLPPKMLLFQWREEREESILPLFTSLLRSIGFFLHCMKSISIAGKLALHRRQNLPLPLSEIFLRGLFLRGIRNSVLWSHVDKIYCWIGSICFNCCRSYPAASSSRFSWDFVGVY